MATRGFGFVCATPDPALASELRDTVTSLLPQSHGEGVRTWADRSVPVRLGKAGVVVRVVPLSCGATGSCSWAILAASPARSLGVVQGHLIRPRDLGDEWPALEVFSSYGAGEGDLATYRFRDGSYRRVEVGKLTRAAVNEYMSCIDNEACCEQHAT